ncbi:MAG: D-alanyl-D-alanine carboxypeptidase/D-alanyl-D-alanine endopeptidase [Acidimicrobiia bacterium]
MTVRPDGDLARRALAGALAVVAVVAVVLALHEPGAASAGARSPTLGTPVWSVRRLPDRVADAAERERLQSTLTSRVAGDEACFDVRDPSATAASASPDTALIPASTLKLLTATAALARLGPDFHFTTTVVAPDAPTAGNVARLFLVGGGDPLLATPERIALLARDPEYVGLATSPLATLADRIVAAGVKTVPGGVVGVDGRYDRTRYQPSWNASTRAAIGPIGALTVNDGQAGPAGTGDAVADPALNAAAELGRLLTAHGVQVGAPARADAAPDRAHPVATLDSPPLPEVLTELLSASDNLSAEMLTRELAHAADPTRPATTAAGVAAIRTILGRIPVDLTGAVLVDGSGLAREDRLRCPTLLQILELTGRRRFAPVAAGLAIAAKRGTLATELHDTPLAGNLRAKTGTLDGVSGLAGFVTADRPLTFALIVNGAFGEAGAFAIREAMVRDIAAFGSGFPLDVVPAPNRPIPPRACSSPEGPC